MGKIPSNTKLQIKEAFEKLFRNAGIYAPPDITAILDDAQSSTDVQSIVTINTDDFITTEDVVDHLENHEECVDAILGHIEEYINSNPIANPISVKSFGALGNDIQDDTDFIQAAIDAAHAVRGGAVYFPKGVYRITKPLRVTKGNVRLFGDGFSSWINANTKDMPAIVVYPSEWTGIPTAAALNPGNTGNSMVFADNNEYWLNLREPGCGGFDPPPGDWDGLSAFTFSCWYRPTQSGGPHFIVSSSGSLTFCDTPDQCFWVQYNEPGFVAKIRTENGYHQINASGSYPLNNTYHLEVNYDAVSHTFRFFIDGVLRGSTTDPSGNLVQKPWEDVILGPQFDGWRQQRVQGGGPGGRVGNVQISRIARHTTGFTVPNTHTADSNSLLTLNFNNNHDIFTIGSNIVGGPCYFTLHHSNINAAVVGVEIDHLTIATANRGIVANSAININLHDLNGYFNLTDFIYLRTLSYGSFIKNITSLGCQRGSHVATESSGLITLDSAYLVGGLVTINSTGNTAINVSNVYTIPKTTAPFGPYSLWLQGDPSALSSVQLDRLSVSTESGANTEAVICLDSLNHALLNNVMTETANDIAKCHIMIANPGAMAATENGFPTLINNHQFYAPDMPSESLIMIKGDDWKPKVQLNSPIFNIAEPIAICDTEGVVSILDSGQQTNLRGLSGTDTLANNLRGSFTVSAGATTGTVTFTVEEPDNNYKLVVTPVSDTGTPAAGSNRVKKIAKSEDEFVVTIEAAPGDGASVTFDWILIR